MSELLSTVIPVYLTVALGYLLTRTSVVPPAFGSVLIRFMYFLAIPAMLFINMLDATLPLVFPWRFLIAFYVPTLLLFSVGMVVSSRILGWRRQDIGIAGMTASYSNVVLLGFPLVLSVFGREAVLPLFILLASQSVLLFPVTTLVLESTAERREGDAPGVAATLLRVFLNPVVLSLLLGIAANLGGIGLPALLGNSLRLVASVAPVGALIALGITLAGYRLAGPWHDVSLFLLLKNAGHPLLVWLGCSLLGIESRWMAVAVLLAAMPSGINAFIFAARYQCQVSTVSRTIVWSTLLSTLVASILVMRSAT